MRCIMFCGSHYGHLFGKYLLSLNTFSSSLFMVTGGAITQALEQDYGIKTHWELRKLGNLAVVGGVIGLQQHYLYLHADHKWSSQKPAPLFKKLIFDHIVITNITLVTFFSGLNLLEGVHPYHILDEFIEKYWITYPLDVGIGLPTQLYNFYYLPAKYRVVFVAAVSTMTAVVLTFLKDIAESPPSQEQQAYILVSISFNIGFLLGHFMFYLTNYKSMRIILQLLSNVHYFFPRVTPQI